MKRALLLQNPSYRRLIVGLVLWLIPSACVSDQAAARGEPQPSITKEPSQQKDHAASQTPLERAASAEAYHLYTQSEVYHLEGDTLTAIELIRDALSYDSDSAYLRIRLAELYLETGEIERSQEHIKKVLDLAPASIKAQHLYAYTLYLSDQNQEAKIILEQLLEQAPGNRPASALLADVFLDMHQIEKAEDVIQALMHFEPDAIDGYITLAGLFAKRGNIAASETYIDLALARDSRSVEALEKKIEVLQSQGRFEESLQYVRRVVAERGDSHQQRHALLVNMILAGEYDSARELRELWLEENKSESMHLLIANAYEEAGAPSEALDILLGIDDTSTSIEVQSTVGRLMMEAGWYVRATEFLCDTNAGSWQVDWKLHLVNLCVRSHLYAGDTQTAWATLSEARMTYPYAWQLLEAQLEMSEYPTSPISQEEVLADIQSARQVQPTNTSLLELEVKCLELLGQTAQASKRLIDALQQRANIEVWMIQARHLERSGNKRGALEVIERVFVDIESPSIEHLNFAAYTLADNNQNLKDAKTLAWCALVRAPLNGYIIDTLGWAQYRNGEFEKSKETLLRANLLSPREPEILLHLGMVHQSLGNEEEAIRFTREGLDCITYADPIKPKLENLLNSLETSE